MTLMKKKSTSLKDNCLKIIISTSLKELLYTMVLLIKVTTILSFRIEITRMRDGLSSMIPWSENLIRLKFQMSALEGKIITSITTLWRCRQITMDWSTMQQFKP